MIAFNIDSADLAGLLAAFADGVLDDTELTISDFLILIAELEA